MHHDFQVLADEVQTADTSIQVDEVLSDEGEDFVVSAYFLNQDYFQWVLVLRFHFVKNVLLIENLVESFQKFGDELFDLRLLRLVSS